MTVPTGEQTADLANANKGLNHHHRSRSRRHQQCKANEPTFELTPPSAREGHGELGLHAASHACYAVRVKKTITQRQLRNDSGEVMRALDSGDSFVVTRNGIAVGELVPIRRQRFVAKDAVLTAFAHSAPIDAQRFRDDIDRTLEQDPTPRA